MTLAELHDVLGKRIELAQQSELPIEERAKEAEISMTISSLAKQMINNADVVLRAEKLIGEGKLIHSNIARMIGEVETIGSGNKDNA